MAKAFVIRNQDGQYLTKKGEWVSGKEVIGLYHQAHHDQALNQLIEVNAKDIYLRGTILELDLCEKRRPIVLEYGPDPEQPELLSEDAPLDNAQLESGDLEPEAEGESKEAFSGFIRPLNVEPRGAAKKAGSDEVVGEA